MRRLPMLSTLLGLLILLRLAAAAAQAPEAASAPTQDESAQQVLVMLQLPRPHFRPDGAYGGNYGDGTGQLARQHPAGRLGRQ